MAQPDDIERRLFEAGAGALRFNAPLGDRRASDLVDALSQAGVTAVADLGCGKGELAQTVASRIPKATVVGVDSDERLVRAARERAAAHGLSDRLSFEAADAAMWSGTIDAVICVGASHAFGTPADMFGRFALLVADGSAVVGEGFWQSSPDDWCRRTFGDLPDGLDALAGEATRAGWTVVTTDQSNLEEWDRFEMGWIEGVQSVGSEKATAFAEQRQEEYQRYRGVLGFGWLVLRR